MAFGGVGGGLVGGSIDLRGGQMEDNGRRKNRGRDGLKERAMEKQVVGINTEKRNKLMNVLTMSMEFIEPNKIRNKILMQAMQPRRNQGPAG